MSKPCCPECARVLGVDRADSDSFIFRGSHQTLTSCTLPNWAPQLVADDAIKHYKVRLRDALEKVMATAATSIQSRSRALSTQSDRLSLDTRENESHTFAKERYKDLPHQEKHFESQTVMGFMDVPRESRQLSEPL